MKIRRFWFLTTGVVSVLFSEPKIPQLAEVTWIGSVAVVFQCSSASRKFLNTSPARSPRGDGCRFSALQRAENSSMATLSEALARCVCFSALQRAENSSIGGTQKMTEIVMSFSALQRAENSSILIPLRRQQRAGLFQCSSASRKFLNDGERDGELLMRSFQCSSASRKFLNSRKRRHNCRKATVSVLFSEPKIPQYHRRSTTLRRCKRFSALQRAENSSIRCGREQPGRARRRFSALQRAENSSITETPPASVGFWGFSALQRAENSSIQKRRTASTRSIGFSALQRAENSSI